MLGLVEAATWGLRDQDLRDQDPRRLCTSPAAATCDDNDDEDDHVIMTVIM